MFSKKFQRKYALTDQGVRNTKKGAFWTVIVNLIVMGGASVLYIMMSGFMDTLTDGSPLPSAVLAVGMVVLFVVLSLATHLQQYEATYGLVYNEVKATRLSLAERLRKLPLGYFGKRDLADLTETLMRDVNSMEHVWSHVLGYLYGSYISRRSSLSACSCTTGGWQSPAFGASRLPLGCCSAAARSAAAALNGRKRPRLPFRTAFRRRWKTCGRSAPPIRRSDISKG